MIVERLGSPKLATLAHSNKSTSETAIVYEKSGPRWYFEPTTGIIESLRKTSVFSPLFASRFAGSTLLISRPTYIVRFAR